MILTSTKFKHYQKWLTAAHSDIERIYYDHVDELTQKLGDLDLPGLPPERIPAFALKPYIFISQWEDGEISSTQVYDVFVKMNNKGDGLRTAARAKVIKPLVKFMMEHESLATFVKYTISILEVEVVPKMIKYLEMLMKFYEHTSKTDSFQIPITWVQQTFEKGEITIRSDDLSLNQALKQLQSYVMYKTDQTFYHKDGVVVFDQIDSIDERYIHWLFAPRTYIELLRSIFDINTSIEGKKEEDYLRELLKDLG